MSIVIRPARPDDADAIGELTARAYLDDGLVEPDDEYLPELSDGARRVAEATVLVAEDTAEGQAEGHAGSQVVGSITVAPAGNPWAEMAQEGEVELRMLAVATSHRRLGIGRRLAIAGIEAGRQLGARAIILCSMDTMTGAHHMYDQMGFERVPARDWGVPSVHLLAYRLVLE